MPDQPPYPHLPYPDRLAAAWADAANSGITAERFLDGIEGLVHSMQYDATTAQIRKIQGGGPQEAARLGYTQVEYGSQLYAVRRFGFREDTVWYSVVLLGETAGDDVEFATFSTAAFVEPFVVQKRARDQITHMHAVGTPLRPSADVYAVFRHDGGNTYEIHQIGPAPHGFRCSVIRLGTGGAHTQVALFDRPAAGGNRKNTIALAVAAIEHAGSPANPSTITTKEVHDDV